MYAKAPVPTAMMARNGQNLTVAFGPRGGRVLYVLRYVAGSLILDPEAEVPTVLNEELAAVVNVVIFGYVDPGLRPAPCE